jgi:WD40 repeat protein
LFEPSGALLTNGQVGLWRWPVNYDMALTELVRVGPPQRIFKPGSVCEIAHSQDGRVLAMAQFDGGLILDPDGRNPPIPLTPHEDVRYIAVSPDGRLVATGSHNGTKVKIWDGGTGKLSKELPIKGGSRVGFSPDGRWLATNGSGCRLWEVGVWEERASIGGGSFAFSPDSKVLAVETDKGTIRLVDPERAREYARLEDPHRDRAFTLGFSPDGTQLVTTNRENQSIHVWDLRAIRRQLADMGLDWDQPPYPAPEVSPSAIPLRVTVDLGELAKPLAKEPSR